jgi:hypothetical protein
MEKNPRIHKEVTETLERLDHIETIQCSPNYTKRLLAKIKADENRRRQPLTQLFFKPAFIPILVSLVVLINVSSVIYVFQGSPPNELENEGYLSAYLQEYTLDYYESDVFTFNQ